ncbi:hypothetical protein PF010_g30233 [Phytophthora fragariae]|uniref:Uncharacterized protein n=1 Tax=Phytophthora fragariae TaxID=53985 RepID=A0A6A4AY16_9STRA|nr:hypothetical protein PF010_g30233 [Phytophthora fragariae]KAE9263798.1 hypothetical protein PF001_g31539 [Phytophthora fragariae]
MSKRKCVNRTEQEKINLLKEWRDNPEWDIQEASRRLGVKEATLRGWKKLYWHRLDSFVGSKRKRKKGKSPGPRRKLKPYEDRVVDYFFSLREEEISRNSAARIHGLTALSSTTPKSWIPKMTEFLAVLVPVLAVMDLILAVADLIRTI